MRFKDKNGMRMKTTITLFHANHDVTEQDVIAEVEKLTKGEVCGDTAGCIKTTLSLLKQGVTKVQDNLKVFVPVVSHSLLQEIGKKKELGWILTAEALRHGNGSNTAIIQLAEKYSIKYDPSTKNCIPAGVRSLYCEGLLELFKE